MPRFDEHARYTHFVMSSLFSPFFLESGESSGTKQVRKFCLPSSGVRKAHFLHTARDSAAFGQGSFTTTPVLHRSFKTPFLQWEVKIMEDCDVARTVLLLITTRETQLSDHIPDVVVLLANIHLCITVKLKVQRTRPRFG